MDIVLVSGSPGSGKSTYCEASSMILNAQGRKTKVVNLDPGNKPLYECEVDIRNLYSFEDAVRDHNLGPNGAILYCMEYLEQNIEWLINQIQNLESFLIFDLPGQVELFVHHSSVQNILQKLEKLGYSILMLWLVDANQCLDQNGYMSAYLNSLSTMVHVSMPQINVLSKVDLVKKYELEIEDFFPKNTFAKKLKEIIMDYDLVFFQPLSVTDGELMHELQKKIDSRLQIVTDFN